ncbi:DUF2061 domain-containing protein [Vibrio ulleungensis]|jgi:uncharacterized membrane protein|uniref:DUF2061 domain-containing protein n=1 Tax=Vibrio ulleungensis TaxID=2807619 RepID=A0ABS2HQ29_9VIBR|nr:DUF2061 domain-containing protein [Vibrio ulleungensis]MBM7037981.1 DUF2061 domain-containing protein [Vibrio ulleungensis]
MNKTISFAAIHFSIATIVAYALTGDLLLGSLIAMIEPTINTGAFYLHEKVWAGFANSNRKHLATIKTISFATVHFSVAFTVVYLLTGDALAGGIIATLEPALNSVAYYFHEKVWIKRSQTHTQLAHS